MLRHKNLKLLTTAIQYALKVSKKHNLDCEVSASINIGLSVNVRMQNIDAIEFNNDQKISVTVYFNHHQGTATTTELTELAIENAVLKAKSIANFTNPDPYSGLPDPNIMAKNFIDLDLYHPENIEPTLAINTAKICESAALNFNPAIKNSDRTNFSYNSSFIAIGNSNDFIATIPTTSYSLSCEVIAQEKDIMQRDYDFTVARCLHDLIDSEKIGKKAALYALNRLGAKQLATCKAKVLFIPRVASSLLGYLVAAIDGSSISNKASFLLDSLNCKIFPNFIDIIDDPFVKRGLGSNSFDSDGVATKKQNIITAGVLNTYLLSNYFAKKLQLSPTGHGGGIYNLFINSTSPMLSYEQLIQKMHTGLIVTETIGHGVNLVTGDYSKGAFGFWVENGKIMYPVEEITIAGNLKEMFNNIVAIGSDLDYQNNIVTGSILIDSLTIAGN